jgi:hypothetical protein
MKTVEFAAFPLRWGGIRCLSNRAKTLKAVLSILFSTLLLPVFVQFVAAQQTSSSSTATTTATVYTYLNLANTDDAVSFGSLNLVTAKGLAQIMHLTHIIMHIAAAIYVVKIKIRGVYEETKRVQNTKGA